MNTNTMTRASKHASWLLRHGANESGLAMDAAGWARVDDVLAILKVSRAELDAVVAQNDKSRLEVDGDRIRACQGHSLAGTPVTREALEASWEEFAGDASAWHGTRASAVAGIAREGILAVERSHVHLAPEPESHVGKRASVDVLLEVSPARLRAAGLRLFRSPNGVLLVRTVPPECIVGLRALTRRARAEEPTLRAALGLAPSPAGGAEAAR